MMAIVMALATGMFANVTTAYAGGTAHGTVELAQPCDFNHVNQTMLTQMNTANYLQAVLPMLDSNNFDCALTVPAHEEAMLSDEEANTHRMSAIRAIKCLNHSVTHQSIFGAPVDAAALQSFDSHPTARFANARDPGSTTSTASVAINSPNAETMWRDTCIRDDANTIEMNRSAEAEATTNFVNNQAGANYTVMDPIFEGTTLVGVITDNGDSTFYSNVAYIDPGGELVVEKNVEATNGMMAHVTKWPNQVATFASQGTLPMRL